VLSAGSNSDVNEPFFDIGTDYVGLVLLYVVKARTKLNDLTGLKPFHKALGESNFHFSSRFVDRKGLDLNLALTFSICG